jgi:glycolate oxidase iron-sulfur subunit
MSARVREAGTVRLGLDEERLASCVQCGLCLPHCPTWRVTGEEAASPRGRIAAMRRVQWDGDAAGPEFLRYVEACVLCRGCETACPAGVPFGRLMEQTREALAAGVPSYQRRWRRAAYAVLGHHRLLLALSSVAAIAQRARLVPRRLGLPRLPVRREPLRPRAATGEPVWLFTGCVMDAWMRPTHAAVLRVLEAAGATVHLPGPGGACCGALHVHAGLGAGARALAARVMAALPGDDPVLVDSAGCGAALKDYGHLLGTPEAERFAARVMDVHEWVAPRIDRLPPRGSGAARPAVAVQDPCHLRHVQRAHMAVRTVLAPYVDVVELDDEGLCCGAGGAYAALQPELAGAIRARKLDAIAASGADVVASANPGCALHLAAAGSAVRHPLELVDAAIGRAQP